MKKLIFLLIIIPFILFSCKKVHSGSPSPSGKKYKVTFNVSNFSQRQGTFSSKVRVNALSSDTITNLNGYLNLLYYEAYNNFGRAENHPPIVQDSTMANMGTITDSLPSGTYQIYFVAGKKGLMLNNYYLNAQANYGYGGYNWQDTFWGTANITVGSADIKENIILNRSVGKIELQILDNIPANADSLIMTIAKDNNVLSLNGAGPGIGQVDASKLAVLIPASAKGHPNFTIDKLVAGAYEPFTITIACKDAWNNIIAQTTVNNVSVSHNTKIILSGKLFTGTQSAPQEFKVKVDTAWNSTPINVGF